MSQVIDAAGVTETSSERGFTESERNEIIARLQAVENRLAGMDNMLTALCEFHERFAKVLDAVGGNPMLAAMMPGLAETMES